MKTFGERVREHRQAKDWSLRDLAEKVGVGFTCLSRVVNERLNFGDYPSDALIHRLADALKAVEDELVIWRNGCQSEYGSGYFSSPMCSGCWRNAMTRRWKG